MGKKFEEGFNSPVGFYPDGSHISRNAYTREQAALEIGREHGCVIRPDNLKESWVRFQFASEDVRDEMGCEHCWMEVPEGTKNAQPTWFYSDE